MSFLSWLRNRPSTHAPRARAQRRPTAPRVRPQLEALDGRCLPSTLTVTSPKDHGPGTLRAEIAAANANDVIVFSPKLDGQTITLTTGELDITKNMTIQGPGAGQLTISGNSPSTYSSRVFEVAQNTTVTLTGLTISNGDGLASAWAAGASAGCGGGILNHGTLTVSGCTISSNHAHGLGGGIYSDGSLTVSGCTITNNSAGNGGGIGNAGTATVSNTTVSSNLTDDLGFSSSLVGGGILNYGTLTVSGCTVTGNSATGGGGGIYNAGTLTVSGSVFSGNVPDDIDGPYTDGGGNTFSTGL